MKFEINNITWHIIELSVKQIQEIFSEDEYPYGYCDYVNNRIYINDKLCEERKKNTLMHELTHCWTMSNGWSFSGDVDRETVCNIVACSNYFINDIMNKYFNKGGNKK